MTRKLLTSDRLVFMAFFFGFASGFLIVIASALLLNTFDRLGVATLFILTAVLLWVIGFRHRYVWLQGSDVRVTWGNYLPIPLHRYPARSLADFSLIREQRFTVMHTYGTGVNRASRSADRFRLRAKENGKVVNLGSYATEQLAKEAQHQIENL